MIDERLYCETFSRLRASEKAKLEVLNKMETQTMKRKYRPLRTAGLVAAIVAALCVTAGAVNAATGGELFELFTITWTNGYQMEMEDQEGNAVNAYLLGGEVAKADGRLILRACGREVDITDALEQEGYYRFEDDSTGASVVIEITGDTEEWTMNQSVDGEDLSYSFFSYDGDQVTEIPGENPGDADSGGVSAERNGSYLFTA